MVKKEYDTINYQREPHLFRIGAFRSMRDYIDYSRSHGSKDLAFAEVLVWGTLTQVGTLLEFLNGNESSCIYAQEELSRYRVEFDWCAMADMGNLEIYCPKVSDSDWFRDLLINYMIRNEREDKRV